MTVLYRIGSFRFGRFRYLTGKQNYKYAHTSNILFLIETFKLRNLRGKLIFDIYFN